MTLSWLPMDYSKVEPVRLLQRPLPKRTFEDQLSISSGPLLSRHHFSNRLLLLGGARAAAYAFFAAIVGHRVFTWRPGDGDFRAASPRVRRVS